LNSNACWSGNYAEPDEMSMETLCGQLKVEDEVEKGWELLKRTKFDLLDPEKNWLRWTKDVGYVGDAEERLWRYKMDLDISPKPKSFHILMQIS